MAEYAGLGAISAVPPVLLVDRTAWAAGALATLAETATPLEARLAAELALPGPLGALARRAAGAAVGAEAGIAAGYAAGRVLGQYDVSIVGPPRPARLLFVGENIESARRQLGADPELFLSWIALHEIAHVVQFERVEWLADHVRRLVATLIEGVGTELDAGSLGERAKRIALQPNELARALLRGELARALAGPALRRTFDGLQATMSVIEGHAEHVMDGSAAGLDLDLGELRRRLDARRARGGLRDLIGRLLGMDLKLRQYELGRRFCDAVVAEAGPAGLRVVWRGPDELPSLGELERPSEWLRRVGAAPSPAASARRS